MEQKQSKTGAIIGTIAAVLLCGCPGLALCLSGALTVFGVMPWNGNLGNQYYANLPSWLGFVFLCLSIILIAIPIVVGVLTLRDKKPVEGVIAPIPPSEPLPPAS